MAIFNKKYSWLVLALLAPSCMSYSQDTKAPSSNSETQKPKTEITVLNVPVGESVERSSYDRPLDIAPLVSNYLAARFSESEGRTEDAAYFYDQAEAADPENRDLKERAFSLQLAIGNIEDSIRLAQELTTGDDPLPMAYILLGSNAMLNGSYKDAELYFSKASEASPTLLQFHILKGYLSYEQNKNIEKAIGFMKDAPEISGLSPLRHYHMGRLYERADMMDKAEEQFELAYEGDRSSSFIILALERLYERTHQQDKLKKVFQRFVKENPGNVMLLKSIERFEQGEVYHVSSRPINFDAAEVMFEIATMMSGQGLSTSASQLINISLWLNPEDEFVAFYKGLLYEQQGAYEHAMAVYKDLQDTSYTWLGGQIRIADMLARTGRSKEAVQFVRGLTEKYSYPVLKRILAEFYYASGAYEEAISLYDMLLKEEDAGTKEPDLSQFAMYFARGTAYERLEQYQKAEKDLMESIRLDPNNATALNYLGYMWLEQQGLGRLDDAVSLIGRALLLRPDDAAILDSMGWALFLQGEFDKSAQFLERAAERRPDDSTINMHLGDVYESLSRFVEARLHWQRALDIGADTPKDEQYLRDKLNNVSAKLK